MHNAVTLLPGLVFLLALWLMDSFKLVRRTSIALALLYGAAAALFCGVLHAWLIVVLQLDLQPFARYVSPLTEETSKAVFVSLLIVRRRIGFLVDAAVLGFAVGTGFAMVENAVYLSELGDAPFMLWVIRGLGTGVLHGATTAVAGIVAKAMIDRHTRPAILAFLPGWALAVVVHSTYNHLLVYPVLAAVAVLLALPALVVGVFEQSEKATREWVGAGLDLDLELLQLLTSEHVRPTRFGKYLRELRDHFDGGVVADMFCLLRLELELAVQAKAMLMAREAGLEIPIDDDLQHALGEWRYLRHSIGRMGLLALEPLRVTTDRDDWHRYLLSQAGTRTRWRRWLGSR
jgi:RsiW-degrading membrane proteinase PrsW (M82 family)